GAPAAVPPGGGPQERGPRPRPYHRGHRRRRARLFRRRGSARDRRDGNGLGHRRRARSPADGGICLLVRRGPRPLRPHGRTGGGRDGDGARPRRRRPRTAARADRRRRIDARRGAPHSGRESARALRGLAAGLYGGPAGLNARGENAMAMAASEIERLIKLRIPDAEVTIRDLAGDGDHYAATVLAESFRGKSRVQQHQIVYEALKTEMGGKLHALALQTGTPEP